MSIKEQALLWLTEYCCLKKYSHSFHEIIKLAKDGSFEIAQKINSTRLATLFLHDVVIDKFDFLRFHIAIHTAAELYNVIPSDAVSFKLFAKVTTALKIKVLLEMLKTGNKFVLPRLNEYFPRTGIDHPKADKALATKLGAAQLKFRRFVFSMIASKAEQEAYFKEEYDKEYGQDYKDKVKDLMQEYISAIDKLLPATHIERLAMDGSSKLGSEVLELKSPAINLLLDMCQEKQLTEYEVTDIAKAVVSNNGEKPVLPQTNVPSPENSDPVANLLETNNRQAVVRQLPKTVSADVCHCSFGSLQPSGELFSFSDTDEGMLTTPFGKTQVPLGKVYRMNYKQSKQTKRSSSRSFLKEQVDYVYKTIQSQTEEIRQGVEDSRVETITSTHPKNSRKRLRSLSPEDGVSTSQDKKESKKQCTGASVTPNEQQKSAEGYPRKQSQDDNSVRAGDLQQNSLSCTFHSQASDSSQLQQVDTCPEQVYTISSSSGCEESSGTSQQTQEDSVPSSDSQGPRIIGTLYFPDKCVDETTQKSNGSENQWPGDQSQTTSQVKVVVISLSEESGVPNSQDVDKQEEMLDCQADNDQVMDMEDVTHDEAQVVDEKEDILEDVIHKSLDSVRISSEPSQNVFNLKETESGCIERLTRPGIKRLKLSHKQAPCKEHVGASNSVEDVSDVKRLRVGSGMSSQKSNLDLSRFTKTKHADFDGSPRKCSTVCEKGKRFPSNSESPRKHKKLVTDSSRVHSSGKSLQEIGKQEELSIRGLMSGDRKSVEISVMTSNSPTAKIDYSEIVSRATCDINPKSPEVTSPLSDATFYSCATSPQHTTLFDEELETTPFKSALELPMLDEDNTDQSTNTTLVEDSENEIALTHTNSAVLPSSNSMNKYDVMLEFGKETLPQFDKYLRHDKAKLCVVKLFRNQAFDHTVDHRRYKVFS